MKVDRKQAILKERAGKAAQLAVSTETIAGMIEVVQFQLADETYAIESQYVREVYPLKDFTPLPCVPPYVFGLINVRRQILSVIDLRVLFGLPLTEKVKDEKVIILDHDKMSFAIRTDGITGVQRIAQDDIQPPLPTITGISQEFLKGITANGIVIIDGRKLLSDKQLIVEESIET